MQKGGVGACHLRHRAGTRGLSGGDGRRGACERSCEAGVYAWRMSSVAWSAPCRRGVELVEGAADGRCNPHLPGIRVRGGGRDPPP